MDAGFDKKTFKCKFDYCIGKAANLNDPSLQAKAQDYKRRLSADMRAISGSDIGRIADATGYFVSRKYDGEFAMLAFDGKEIVSLHPSGTVRAGLPCLDEAAEKLKKAKVGSCILGAEYYLIDAAAESRSLEQVLGVLRSPKNKAELDRVGLAVFDVVELDGKRVTTASAVYKSLDAWFKKGKNVHTVEYKQVNKNQAIAELFLDWAVGEGAAER
jgi:hypothetical protein